MTKYKLEYIWLDGYTPVPNLRGKTQIKEFDAFPDAGAASAVGLRRQLDHAGRRPQLRLRAEAGRGFSGRRAQQRRAGDVRSHDAGWRHPARDEQARHHPRRSGRLVRLRAGILHVQGRPSARLPDGGYPAPQGPYYTGVGYSNVGSVAREIVEKHLDLCLAAGINHEGINAEVAKGQWEFQIFGKGSKKAADEMWMARYLMQRLTETYGIDIEYHCKPLGDTDWNGSGMHANFSTEYLRTVGGKAYFEALMAAFEKNLMDHIAVYGPDNDKRLTGKHETAPWNKFSYGVADRGASIRVPHCFVKNDATRAISKTAGRTRKATPTRSLRRS